MRGRHVEQEVMLAYVNLEERVPKDHPLRTIKTVADAKVSVWCHIRLVEGDRFGQGYPQGMQVGRLVQGQPSPHPGVDLHCLGEQLRSPALGLDLSVAGLEGAGGALQGPVVAGCPPVGAVAPGHPWGSGWLSIGPLRSSYEWPCR